MSALLWGPVALYKTHKVKRQILIRLFATTQQGTNKIKAFMCTF